MVILEPYYQTITKNKMAEKFSKETSDKTLESN
jgi:hypothetical protein